MASLVVQKTFKTQLKNNNLRIRLIAIGIVIFVWQVGVSGLGKPFMATPLGILQAIPTTLFNDKKLWPGVFETFGVVFQGISISVLIGVVLGLMMGRIPAISYAFAPYVNGFYATPMVAVLPLFTLWFGFNVSATLALVLFAAIPPMAVAAWAASISRRSYPSRSRPRPASTSMPSARSCARPSACSTTSSTRPSGRCRSRPRKRATNAVSAWGSPAWAMR